MNAYAGYERKTPRILDLWNSVELGAPAALSPVTGSGIYRILGWVGPRCIVWNNVVFVYKEKERRITVQTQLYLCMNQLHVSAIYSQHQEEYRTINKKEQVSLLKCNRTSTFSLLTVVYSSWCWLYIAETCSWFIHRYSCLNALASRSETPGKWCWRRMEIIWTDHVRNEEVLLRVKELRNILHEISTRKANWVGHILRRNCLLQRGIEGKMKGG
jgi:hypothetical protein